MQLVELQYLVSYIKATVIVIILILLPVLM